MALAYLTIRLWEPACKGADAEAWYQDFFAIMTRNANRVADPSGNPDRNVAQWCVEYDTGTGIPTREILLDSCSCCIGKIRYRLASHERWRGRLRHPRYTIFDENHWAGAGLRMPDVLTHFAHTLNTPWRFTSEWYCHRFYVGNCQMTTCRYRVSQGMIDEQDEEGNTIHFELFHTIETTLKWRGRRRRLQVFPRDGFDAKPAIPDPVLRITGTLQDSTLLLPLSLSEAEIALVDSKAGMEIGLEGHPASWKKFRFTRK